MQIDYFTIPELPEKPLFKCERRSATIQPGTCASMWREANGKHPPERCLACKNCRIGAHHAGEGDVSLSQFRGATICGRCHRIGMRLVAGHLCVSCWNREREYLIGRNRRGIPPATHPELHRISVSGVVIGEVKVWQLVHAVSVLEGIVAVLRDCPKRVVFGFSRRMDRNA